MVNSLTELKDKISGVYTVLHFNGLELRTNVGVFGLGPKGFYLDNVLLTKEEMKEVLGGKLQTRESKECESRLPDVQTAQGKRSKTRSPRATRSTKTK